MLKNRRRSLEKNAEKKFYKKKKEEQYKTT